MQKDIIVLLLFCVVLFHSEQTQYTPKKGIPVDGELMGYSPSHLYLLSITGNEITYYDGLNFTQLRTVSAPETVSCFTFSPDESLLSIGSQTGNAYIFNMTSDQPSEPITVEANKIVSALSFSKNISMDNENMLAMAANRKVVVASLSEQGFTDQRYERDFGVRVNSLDWDLDGMLLVGGGDGVTKSLLEIVDPAHGFKVVQQLTVPTLVTSDAKYSDDAAIIVRVGGINYKNIDVYEVQQGFKMTPYQGTVPNIQRVMISIDKMHIVAIADASVAPFQKDSSSDAYSPQAAIPTLADCTDKVSLSFQGGQLILPSSSGNQLYSLCALDGQTYSPEQNKCIECVAECLICLDSSSNCYTCRPDNYLVDKQCKPCIQGCLVCQNADNCTTCDGANHYVKNSKGQCECGPRYFNDTHSMACEDCQRGCLRCQDNITCQGCDVQNHFFRNSTDQCQCNPGYGEINQQCFQCDNGYGCLNCDDNASFCKQCDTNAHFIKQNETDPKCECDDANNFIANDSACICRDPYYQNPQHVCTFCPTGCSSCSGPTSCSTCFQGFKPDDSNCICSEVDEHPKDRQTCQLCNQTVQFCTACTYEFDTHCTKCDVSLHRQLNVSNGQCDCATTYFLKESVCVSCVQPGCDRCLSETQCTQCSEAAHWNSNATEGKCTCKVQYYNISNVCTFCGYGCLKCIGQHDCQSCNSAAHFSPTPSKICACDSGYYLRSSRCETCNKAMVGCLRCQSFAICLQCKPQFELQSHKCECPKGMKVNNEKHTCEDEGVSIVIIIGIVVGTILLIVAGFAVWKCWTKKRSALEQEGKYEDMIQSSTEQ